MLVNWTAPKHVFIVCGKTGLRKGIAGLAAVVKENYELDLLVLYPVKVTLKKMGLCQIVLVKINSLLQK